MTRSQDPRLNAGQPKIRIPENLGEPLVRRLNAYGLAAGAAGVSLIACASPASAAPICGKLSVTFNYTGTYAFNPAHQKITPFNIAQTYNTLSSFPDTRDIRGFFTPNTPDAKIILSSRGLPSALVSAATIGPGEAFDQPRWYGMLFSYHYFDRFTGNFQPGHVNYAGFQFAEAGQTHYGWLRIRIGHPTKYGYYPSLLLSEYGYESSPNTAITAGSCAASASSKELSSPSESTLTMKENKAIPPTLGALALGSQSLPFWRRETPFQQLRRLQ